METGESKRVTERESPILWVFFSLERGPRVRGAVS